MPEEESPQAETLPVVLAQHDVVVAATGAESAAPLPPQSPKLEAGQRVVSAPLVVRGREARVVANRGG